MAKFGFAPNYSENLQNKQWQKEMNWAIYFS